MTAAEGDERRQGLLFDGLSFRYPAVDGLPVVPVLEGAGLSVPRGSMAVIAGAADAGKTTLARILAGLVPRFTGGALGGTARFGALDLLAARPFDAMEAVGLVFQDPDEQLITTRCDAEVAFGLESLGIGRAEMLPRVGDGLALMGLEPFRDRSPGTLSGGEKKRLLISCLAAVDPALWILDEVFQELDHAWRVALMDHLAKSGRTALFLDSRWSGLYDGRCGRASILAGGAVTSVDGVDHDARVARLRDEGLLIPEGTARPGSAGEGFLKAEGIAFHFPGPSSFGLSVEELVLERGTVTAIAGRNGSGKSTLGKLLCGLLAPERGGIALHLHGAWSPANPRTLQERVGYLFQNPDYQIFLPTVLEELFFGIRKPGESDAAARRRVEEAIALFRLPSADSPPALMSYGARRRLQAATAHLLGRDLLILDEIDSGLGYREFLEILPALATAGRGIVIVTHDLSLARHVAGRILVMDGGRIVEDLSPPAYASLERVLGVV